jgi:putative selenate reductase
MNQQIGTIADICNQCGNCDVICPESGGPYRMKPQVFLSRESLLDAPDRDGFTAKRNAEAIEITARSSGEIIEIIASADVISAHGEGFSLAFDRQATSISGQTTREVDIGHILLLVRIAEAVSRPDAHTFLSAALN